MRKFAVETEGIALDKYALKADAKPEGLNVVRILATNIPDLAQVYGGFRGRTLSSPPPAASVEHHDKIGYQPGY